LKGRSQKAGPGLFLSGKKYRGSQNGGSVLDAHQYSSSNGHRVFPDRRQKNVPVETNQRIVERRAIPFKPDLMFPISLVRFTVFMFTIGRDKEFLIKQKDCLPACAVIKLGEKGEEIEKTFTFM